MIIRFPPPPESPWDRYRLTVELRKGSASWSYLIQPIGDTCWTRVWLDGRPHWAEVCRTAIAVERVRARFEREIATLEADGWTRDDTSGTSRTAIGSAARS